MSIMPHSKAPSLALTKARANCAQGYHQWHPTFSLGEKLCPICGAKGFCPVCRGRLPDPKVHVVFCASHQGREENEEEEARST